MNGIITHYNTEKRYGFISTESDDDIFFHITRMKNRQIMPEVGMHVTFNVMDSSKVEGKKEASDIVVSMSSGKFIHIGNLRIKISNIKTYGIAKDTQHGTEAIKNFSAAITSNLQAIQDYQNEIARVSRSKSNLHETIERRVNKDWSYGGFYSSEKTKNTWKKNLRAENISSYQRYDDDIAVIEEKIRETKKNVEELKRNKRAYENSEEYKLAVNNQLEYLYITTYQGDNYTFYGHNSDFDIYEKLREIDEHTL